MTEQTRQTLFARWLEQHGGIVLKIGRAYTFSDQDRQDLVQEILMQLWRSMDRFEARAAESTWIYRVSLNTALSWKRRERRRTALQVPLIEAEEFAGDTVDDVQRVHERESIERLYAAIRQLPKGDAALLLLYLDDLSYREMAEVLGISESNVGVKLTRARQALGEVMKEAAHEL